MLVPLFVFAAAAAVPLPAPGLDLDSERPQHSRKAGEPCGQGAAVTAGADNPANPLLAAGVEHRPAQAIVAGSQLKSAQRRNAGPSVFVEFLGSFRPRRSSETLLPTRDKHLSPLHPAPVTGVDVGAPLGVLQNVHLFSEKELRPHVAIQTGSQPHLEQSASASSGEGLSPPASITEEDRGVQPEVVPVTQEPPPPLVGTTRHWRMTTRGAGSVPADTSTLSNVSEVQKAGPSVSADHATHENITLAYNEYQSSGGSGGPFKNTAEQVVFTDTKSTSLSSGNAGDTVVDVEISKSEMVAAEKETEEIIMKDTTLIIVFSCLAVLVIVVCKIIRYVLEYKLSKHEERVQNTGARPPF